jgi:hypothetical protein
MADFTVEITDGVTVETWSDPASLSVPTRINPFAEHPHKRYVGEVGTEIEVTATVEGVEGEVDANLDGLLFTLYYCELPGVVPPPQSSPAGQSSVQRFTPAAAGHYTFKMKRPEHGAVIMHVDVQ